MRSGPVGRSDGYLAVALAVGRSVTSVAATSSAPLASSLDDAGMMGGGRRSTLCFFRHRRLPVAEVEAGRSAPVNATRTGSDSVESSRRTDAVTRPQSSGLTVTRQCDCIENHHHHPR